MERTREGMQTLIADLHDGAQAGDVQVVNAARLCAKSAVWAAVYRLPRLSGDALQGAVFKNDRWLRFGPTGHRRAWRLLEDMIVYGRLTVGPMGRSTGGGGER